MSPDDDADDDVDGGRPPLPPEDRLWRHPSELASPGSAGLRTQGRIGLAAGERGPTWPVVVVAALVGAMACAGVLAATGNLSGTGTQQVVERVAVTPVVSSPNLRGASGVDALVSAVGPAIARLVVRTPAGTNEATGVLVRDDGLLFTSAHEVAGATAIVVVLADGRRLPGTLVGADLLTDVAVVSIDASDLTVAVLGASASLEVGATAIAVGASRTAGVPSVATGVVSGVDRRVDAGGESMHGMIQTDVPIDVGWSGGPLLDGDGAVIGITTDLGGTTGPFGFATPIDLFRQVAAQLVTSGFATHAWLGIEGADTVNPATLAAEEPDEPGGVVVRSVASSSPAAAAGLAADDVITAVDDAPVTSSSGLVVILRRHQPGDHVVVTYWRQGTARHTSVTIAAHP